MQLLTREIILITIYKFKYVAKPVATYRIHKNNLSSKKKDLQIKEFEIWLINSAILIISVFHAFG